MIDTVRVGERRVRLIYLIFEKIEFDFRRNVPKRHGGSTQMASLFGVLFLPKIEGVQ